VLSTHYSHADLDHSFMLFSLEATAAPGSSKLKRAMSLVAVACWELCELDTRARFVIRDHDGKDDGSDRVFAGEGIIVRLRGAQLRHEPGRVGRAQASHEVVTGLRRALRSTDPIGTGKDVVKVGLIHGAPGRPIQQRP
jgi:hypothetical protein